MPKPAMGMIVPRSVTSRKFTFTRIAGSIFTASGETRITAYCDVPRVGLRGSKLMVSVAGATPEPRFTVIGGLVAVGVVGEILGPAANVIRPPPMLRTTTVAVATMRLQISTESTTFVVLTSRIGRLFNWPMGMTSSPVVEFANRY